MAGAAVVHVVGEAKHEDIIFYDGYFARCLWLLASAGRRLLGRLLEDEPTGSAFSVDFTDRAAAQAIFEEGFGSLLTDGSRSCMDPLHLLYDEPLVALGGARGLIARMDDQDVTCGNDAQIATGHLSSYQKFSYGDFTWVAQIGHAPDGTRTPSNVFSCLAIFVHGGLPHNEIAWCFPARDGREVHMSYWYDDGMHRTVRKVNIDLSASFHSYVVRWRPEGIDFIIDDTLVHQVRGQAGVTVPWEPMFIKVIIRPNNVPSTFLGAAELGLKYFSYVPAFEPVPTEMVMELQRVRQQLLQQLALQMASEQAHQAGGTASGKAAAGNPSPTASPPPPLESAAPPTMRLPLAPIVAPPPPVPSPPWVTIVLRPVESDDSDDLAASAILPSPPPWRWQTPPPPAPGPPSTLPLSDPPGATPPPHTDFPAIPTPPPVDAPGPPPSANLHPRSIFTVVEHSFAQLDGTGLVSSVEQMSDGQLFVGGLGLVLLPWLLFFLLRRCCGIRSCGSYSRSRWREHNLDKGTRRRGRARDSPHTGGKVRGPVLRAAPDDTFVIDEEELEAESPHAANGSRGREGDRNSQRLGKGTMDSLINLTKFGRRAGRSSIRREESSKRTRKPRGALAIVRENSDGDTDGADDAVSVPVPPSLGSALSPSHFVLVEYVPYAGAPIHSVSMQLPLASAVSLDALAHYLLERGIEMHQLGSDCTLPQVRLQLPPAPGAMRAPPLKRISQLVGAAVLRCAIEPSDDLLGRQPACSLHKHNAPRVKRLHAQKHAQKKVAPRRERCVAGARFQSLAVDESSNSSSNDD